MQLWPCSKHPALFSTGLARAVLLRMRAYGACWSIDRPAGEGRSGYGERNYESICLEISMQYLQTTFDVVDSIACAKMTLLEAFCLTYLLLCRRHIPVFNHANVCHFKLWTILRPRVHESLSLPSILLLIIILTLWQRVLYQARVCQTR